MSVQQIPIQQNVANCRVGVSLLGVAYWFDFRWNALDESWWLDVSDAVENPIRTGIKCVIGTFLGRTCQAPPFSQGALICYATTGAAVDAGLSDFGTRVKMVFVPTADLIAYKRTGTFL